MPDTPIPAQLFSQTSDLLSPRALSVQQRIDLFFQAFYTTYPAIIRYIIFDGSAQDFSTHCLQTLWQHDGRLIENLLLALQSGYGEPQSSQIQALIHLLHQVCPAEPPPSRPIPPMQPEPAFRELLTQFHQLLDRHFSEEDLRTLCFRLGLDYDNLGGRGKAANARELLYLLDRTGRLAECRRLVVTHRPQVAWPDVTTGELKSQPTEQPALFISYADEEQTLAVRLQAALARRGYICRLGQAGLKTNEDDWLAATATGLSQAYAVLLLIGQYTHQDRLVQVELLAARDKRKHLIPLRLGDARLPPALPRGVTPLPFSEGDEATFLALLQHLPPQPEALPPETWLSLSPELVERAAELVYMDRLKLAELKHVAQYTHLSGQAEIRRSRGDRLQLQPVVARPEFVHAPWRRGEEAPAERRRFEDAVTELKTIRRAVLLGDPGAGKTTTLYKLAADLIDTATLDKTAPVPLMVRLGLWTEADEPFLAFLRRSVGELAERLETRLRQQRVGLLLDGLNELPAGQQADKYRQVRNFLAQHPNLMVIISCREQDYPLEREVGIDRVTVAPLDAVRVHEFIHHYLDTLYDEQTAEGLFWQLAGEQTHQTYQRFVAEVQTKLPQPFHTFWLAGQLPEGVTWGWGTDANSRWKRWLQNRAHPASLLLLATNPYMLTMLLDVYLAQNHTLPANRGQLFDQFVDTLLARERLAGAERESLVAGLTALAYQMQQQRQEGALTVLPLPAVSALLNEQQRYQAASANLLTMGDEVRFAHQLLQEYFVARAMQQHIFGATLPKTEHWVLNTEYFSPSLPATDIWPPDRWWQPTNWEEATILLAGLYSNDCTPVLTWLAEANPELAARCIVESGAHTPEATKLRLRERWLPRLTDLKHDPTPQARAAVGRALGRVLLADGTPLDNRPGVGFVVQRGARVPDIAWGKTVPAGKYAVGGDKDAYTAGEKRQTHIAHPYQLARYPVTYLQFHCFATAPDFADPRWWAGMAAEEEVYGTIYRLQELSEQGFQFWNHPRESVSWYQAIAFCRWLSHKLGYEVDLPHEDEWEVAARYPDNRFYPWGNTFDSQKANTTEGEQLDQTSAVGIYPHGAQPYLRLDDLSGNVWEWCRNKYEEPGETAVDATGARRVVRGGSWYHNADDARAASRTHHHPVIRSHTRGFRVVRRPLSS